MSTEIKSVGGRAGLTTAATADPRFISVRMYHPGASRIDAQFDRTDFLAAVADELDVVIIERAALPVIEYDPNPGFTPVHRATWADGRKSGTPAVDIGSGGYTAAGARHIAQHMLALAEYLDAHPPVDEAQVEALRGLLRHIETDASDESIARALVATGRIEVKP